MTSQHFQNEADGWGDWGDWNSNNNANNANNDTRNNNIAPALDPQQAPSTMNHNYNYSNQQASQHLFMNQDLSVRPPQFASPTNAPIYSPFGYEAQSVPAAISQPIDYLNHEFVNSNYYQPAQNLQPVFSPVSQHANHISNQLPVHTPIFEKVSPVVLQDDFKPKHAFQPHRTSSPYQLPPEDFGRTVRPPMESFQPGTSNSPPPPPPASSDDLANTNYLSGQNLNLQNNLPPPPPASIFETINKQSEPNRNLENQQFFEVKQTNHNIFWPSKDGQQRVDLSNLEHPETSQPTVPPTPFTDNVENITMNVILEEQKFAEATKMTTPIQSSYSKNLMQTANTLIGNQENRTDNIENMEFNPRPLFSSVQKQHARVTSYVPTPLFGNTNSENIYPENREQLDDNAPINSSDRHNYLVTGQLSQDMNTAGKIQLSMQQQTSPITVQNEVLPPPGLARLVVGQTESNLEQLLAPPPGLNRMVLGTEVDRDDYMSSQRQADGESQPIPPVTAFNPLLQPQNQSYASNIFNIADRNQYLAAGGGNSNINSQRVIPGVESENSLPLITPMQQLSLDLQDDAEMFTGSSNIGGVNFDERNINADGENIDDDQPQVTPQTTREEAIEGANDDSGGARQQPKKTYSTDDSVKNDTNRSEKIRKDRKLKDRRYKDEDYVASNDSDSDKNDNGKRKDGRYKRGNPEEQDSDHYNYKRDKYAR